MNNRTKQYLHKITDDIVDTTVEEKTVIVLENLKGIRKLYKKENGQGNKYRRRMNGWQFFELQRQIEYKAQWAGFPPVRYVDPKNTSTQCLQCGKKLQEDMQHRRKMSCNNCGLFMMDRDVVAPINISCKLSPRFRNSRGGISEAQTNTFELAMSEPYRPVIWIVDMSMLTSRGLTC